MGDYMIYSTRDYNNSNETTTYSYYYDYYNLNTSYSTSFDDLAKRNSTDDSNNFILPWWRQVIWTILFGGMVIVATGGNLIVVWIVMAHKRMRTVTNYFIVNLSIADALVSSLNVTFNYIYMLNSDWPFGQLYCKISQFIAILTICASVFTLMAISIDRYMAIMNPLKPRMGKRTTICIATVIWVIAVIISSPNWIFFTTYTHELKDGTERIICYAEWPDGPTNHSMQEYVYNVLFMFFTYFLPIGSMTYTYARVGLELWGSQSIGECTQRQLDNIKSKRRVVKMMIVVVIIFAVCWLPFHIYFIVTSYYPEITNTPYVQEVYLAIYWLAMSNSMYNPIIYCWMNSRFRRGFKQFFRWCPFVNYVPETLSRREVLTSRYSCSGSPDHNRILRNGSSGISLKTLTERIRSVRLPPHLSCTGPATNSSILLSNAGMHSMNSFNNNYPSNLINRNRTSSHKWTTTTSSSINAGSSGGPTRRTTMS